MAAWHGIVVKTTRPLWTAAVLVSVLDLLDYLRNK